MPPHQPSELSGWLVNNQDILFKRYDIFEIKQRYSHLNRIEFPLMKDGTKLTGTNHADLLLHRGFRV